MNETNDQTAYPSENASTYTKCTMILWNSDPKNAKRNTYGVVMMRCVIRVNDKEASKSKS